MRAIACRTSIHGLRPHRLLEAAERLVRRPDNSPNLAFESLFADTGYKELALGKSFAYSNPYLLADPHKMPGQVVDQIRIAAANRGQEPLSYRDAVVSLCRRSRVENGGNATLSTSYPLLR